MKNLDRHAKRALVSQCILVAVIAIVAVCNIMLSQAHAADDNPDRERQRAAGEYACSSLAIIDAIIDILSEMDVDADIPKDRVTDRVLNLINQVSKKKCVPCPSDAAKEAISDTLAEMVVYEHMSTSLHFRMQDEAQKKCGMTGIFVE